MQPMTGLDQWWTITTLTYELIWPAIPFAIALGIGWHWYKRRK